MFFRQVFDEGLAQYAYMIGCQRTGEAIVIDPERDIDRYVDLADAEGLKIVAVAETHIHADFLSGAREFAEAYGVKLYLSDEGGPDWRYHWAIDSEYDVHLLKHDDRFSIGNIDFRALHTPGHTPEHMAYEVTDRGGGADRAMGIVTGDFVFVGDLGRPDLLEVAAGQAGAMEPSARALHASAESFLEFADYLQVWPGHGAGSACGKALGAIPGSTVGYERAFSPALAAAQDSADAFVEFILADQPEPPPYFARMKMLNRGGAAILGDLPSPEHVSVDVLAAAARRDGALVFDTGADREAFYASHLTGAIHAPLDKSFPTLMGSFAKPDDEVFLIVEEDELELAVRQMVRIGYDNAVGWATPAEVAAAGVEKRSTRRSAFPDVAIPTAEQGLVLDVRKGSEYREGHIEGALNIAHTRLSLHLDELPENTTLHVHCRSGARAAASASYLERFGYDVVLLDGLFEDWETSQMAGAAATG